MVFNLIGWIIFLFILFFINNGAVVIRHIGSYYKDSRKRDIDRDRDRNGERDRGG